MIISKDTTDLYEHKKLITIIQLKLFLNLIQKDNLTVEQIDS